MEEITSRVIVWVIVGGGIAAFGLFELVWGLRTHEPRSTLAQGGFFLQLGLAFATMSILPDGLLRNGLAGALSVGALWAAWTQHTALRAERSARDAPPNSDTRG